MKEVVFPGTKVPGYYLSPLRGYNCVIIILGFYQRFYFSKNYLSLQLTDGVFVQSVFWQCRRFVHRLWRRLLGVVRLWCHYRGESRPWFFLPALLKSIQSHPCGRVGFLFLNLLVFYNHKASLQKSPGRFRQSKFRSRGRFARRVFATRQLVPRVWQSHAFVFLSSPLD